MIYSAFILGLVGSLHCAVMCGPLTLLLPNKSTNTKFLFGRILYNLGRVCTYAILGALSGVIGEQISFFISQKYLSIGVGIIILLLVLLPTALTKRFLNTSFIYTNTKLFKNSFAQLFKKQSLLAQFSFGLVNGLLPCGLIYAALAGSFIMTNWQDAAKFMALFGLGTIPMMLPVSLGFGKIREFLGSNYQKVVSMSYIIIAIWMIYRGINYNKTSLYTAPNQKPAINCETH